MESRKDWSSSTMEIKDGSGTTASARHDRVPLCWQEYRRSEAGSLSLGLGVSERAPAEASTPGIGDYERSAFFGSRLSLSAIRQSSGSDAASILRIMLLR